MNSDIGSIGGVEGSTPSSGAGGGGQRRDKKPAEPQEEPDQSELNQTPILDQEGRLREISEKLVLLQGQLLDKTLDEESLQQVQDDFNSQQIAMENLLSVSASSFDPEVALESLLGQFSGKAIQAQPGAISRLIKDKNHEI